jgi:pimeloyl-ACP methyl ester carboxylesterase
MWRALPTLLGAVVLLAGCGGGGGDANAAPAVTPQEQQCQAAGWQRAVVGAAGLQRLVLWKAPAGWQGPALVVMHGGGGAHTNFCVANVAQIEPQVRFAEAALARGFAVFLLDSHDQVTDSAGRVCGKVWDDEVRARANLDLPFIGEVLGTLIPRLRPSGARSESFLVGHSSGGFMATRAASHWPERVTAFVPVAAGDPYGWTRDCTRLPGDRVNVAGRGLDNETGRTISEAGACAAAAYPNEKPWDHPPAARRPAFRLVHHAQDGINDLSCVQKLGLQLRTRGYPEAPAFRLDGGARSADVHYWLDAYNAPLLDFLVARLNGEPLASGR